MASRATRGQKRATGLTESTPLKVGYNTVIKVKYLKPVVPDHAGEKKRLEDSLQKMGLKALMGHGWSCVNQEIMQELVGRPIPKAFQGTIRGAVNKWTVDSVGQAFMVPNSGKAPFTKGTSDFHLNFAGVIDDHEGFSIDQCQEPELRRVLSFLIPVLCPEKPTRVTLKVGSMVAACLHDGVAVNWAQVLLEVMRRQVSNIRGKKGISLAPYLFILYSCHGLLTEGEMEMYKKAKALAQYGASDSSQEEEETSDKSEPDVKIISTPVGKRRRLEKKYQPASPGGEDEEGVDVGGGFTLRDRNPDWNHKTGKEPSRLVPTKKKEPRAPRMATPRREATPPRGDVSTEVEAMVKQVHAGIEWFRSHVSFLEQEREMIRCVMDCPVAVLHDQIKEMKNGASSSRELKKMEREMNKLKSRDTWLEQRIKAAEEDRDRARAKTREIRHLERKVSDYVSRLKELTVGETSTLVGNLCYVRYLKEAGDNPRFKRVLQLVQDYQKMFDQILVDAKEAAEVVERTWNHIPDSSSGSERDDQKGMVDGEIPVSRRGPEEVPVPRRRTAPIQRPREEEEEEEEKEEEDPMDEETRRKAGGSVTGRHWEMYIPGVAGKRDAEMEEPTPEAPPGFSTVLGQREGKGHIVEEDRATKEAQAGRRMQKGLGVFIGREREAEENRQEENLGWTGSHRVTFRDEAGQEAKEAAGQGKRVDTLVPTLADPRGTGKVAHAFKTLEGWLNEKGVGAALNVAQ